MIDPRTRDALTEHLTGSTIDTAALDRFLLAGPERAAVRRRLTISFHDFWPNFDRTHNFFTAVLGGRFDVTVVEDGADLAIVSVFGPRRCRERAWRSLYFTGENLRPPLDGFDMAVSFDRIEDPRHFRLPLYVVHAWEHVQQGAVPCFCHPLLPAPLPTLAAWRERKFCAFLYRNPRGERRNVFFHALSARRSVDAVGWHLNNTGSVVKDGWLAKIRVFARYRFSFAFENESEYGYVTEKILDGFQARTIPLYWGAPDVAREVNPGSFIDVSRFATDDEAIGRILDLDADHDAYCAVLATPPFLGVGEFHWDAFRLAEWVEGHL